MRRQEILLTLLLICCLAALTSTSQFKHFQFTAEPEDVTAVRDAPLTLNCSASCDCGAVTIQWLKDGLVLANDNRRKVLANGALQFNAVTHTPNDKPDKGIYQCLAIAPGLGKLISRKVHLDIASLAREFTEAPTDTLVHLTEVAVLHCRIDSTPEAQVTWLKDGLPVATSRHIVHSDGSLEISSVQFSDFGRYKCQVTGAGKERSSKEVLLTQNSDVGSYQDVSPHFVATPQDHQDVIEGSTVELVCAANGRDSDAPPTIVWLKDGRTIDLEDENSQRFSIIGQGSLQINLVVESDQGIYTCRASNKEDSIDAEATVAVVVLPRFQQRPMSISAPIYSDAEFECVIYGVDSRDVMWFKNGETIISSNYFQISDGGRKLRVLGLMESDAGIYQCLAENEAGSVQASAQLQVTDTAPGDATENDLPSAPTLLVAAFVSTRFVTLQWRQPTYNGRFGLAGYAVYWNEEGSMRHRMLNTSAMEANVQGLEPSTRYIFRVVAYNTAGTGPESILNLQTEQETTVPSAPLDFKLEPHSPTEVSAVWQPPQHANGDIQGYMLSFYAENEENENLINTTQTSVVISGLRPYTVYHVRVLAINENGQGTSTDDSSVRTLSQPPGAPPQNVTVEVVSSTIIIVKWVPPAKDQQNGIITGFKIWHKEGEQGDPRIIALDTDSRDYQINDLNRDTVYNIRMAAINIDGIGPKTGWFSAKTDAYDVQESEVPGQPLSINVRAMADSVLVGWLPPRQRDIRVRGYELGYGRGIPDQFKIDLPATPLFYTIKNLQPNVEYVISLRAFNSVGSGRQRLETVTTRPETTPEPVGPTTPPVGLKAIVLSNTSILLMWTDTSLGKKQEFRDSRYYTVKFSQRGSNRKNHQLNVTDLNVRIDNLKPNTEYDLTVRVVKNGRHSQWAMHVYNMTMESIPSDAPRDLTPAEVDGHPGWVTLSWQPPRHPNGHINRYLVLYTTNYNQSDSEWAHDRIEGSKLSLTVRGLSPETTYFFKVQARNREGKGPMSPPVVYQTPKLDGTGGGVVDSSSGVVWKLPVPADRGSGNGDIDVNELLTTPAAQDASKPIMSPLLMYILIGCIVLIVLVIIIAFIVTRRKRCRNKKGYKDSTTNAPKKPEDMWINELPPGLNPDDLDEMKPLRTNDIHENPYHRGPPIKVHLPHHSQLSRDRLSDGMSSIGRPYNDIIQPIPVHPAGFSGTPRVNAAHINQSPPVSTVSPNKHSKPHLMSSPTKPSHHVPPDITMNTPLDDPGTGDELMMTKLDDIMRDLHHMRQQDFDV